MRYGPSCIGHEELIRSWLEGDKNYHINGEKASRHFHGLSHFLIQVGREFGGDTNFEAHLEYFTFPFPTTLHCSLAGRTTGCGGGADKIGPIPYSLLYTSTSAQCIRGR